MCVHLTFEIVVNNNKIYKGKGIHLAKTRELRCRVDHFHYKRD